MKRDELALIVERGIVEERSFEEGKGIVEGVVLCVDVLSVAVFLLFLCAKSRECFCVGKRKLPTYLVVF